VAAAQDNLVHADTADDDLDPHFRGADAVIHLAWLFQPTHDELATWRNNVLGAIRVFDSAARARVGTLIYSSSVGAYSPGPQDRRVDESWPTRALPTAADGPRSRTSSVCSTPSNASTPICASCGYGPASSSSTSPPRRSAASSQAHCSRAS
jgi:nucleoside-diphosphate-sugar epimerase